MTSTASARRAVVPSVMVRPMTKRMFDGLHFLRNAHNEGYELALSHGINAVAGLASDRAGNVKKYVVLAELRKLRGDV